MSDISLSPIGQNEAEQQKPRFEKNSFFGQIERHGAKQILGANDSTQKLPVDTRLNEFDLEALHELLEMTKTREEYLRMRNLLERELNNITEA